MKDLGLNNSDIFEMMKLESLRQIKKWGIQDRDAFEWLAYTTEEIGELAKAISEWFYRDGSESDIIFEAIQVATLAAKIAEMFRGSSGTK